MSHVQASCIYHRREMMWRDCHLGPGTGMRAPHLAVGGGWRPRAQPCIPRGHGLASSLSVVFLSFCCCDILRKRPLPFSPGLWGVRCEPPLLLKIELHE